MGRKGDWSLEYEDIQIATKLEVCGSVEMRNWEVGMKYVKDEEVGWTPVVKRRKKSARSEDGGNSGNLNVRLNLIEGRSLVRYSEVKGIPGIFVEACKPPRDGGS